MNAQAVLKKVLLWSVLVTVVFAVFGGVAGYFWLGTKVLYSVLIGAGLVLIFSGITVLSVLFGTRLQLTMFFAAILGSWLIKMVIFIMILLLVRDQAFIDPIALFISLVIGIVATLVVDVLVVIKARMPYVNDPTA